ncbi:hypothetical protein GCM10028803_32900 [Larkinella knui]|uniref:Uncharacterized protein n=1 Tax=Larkinella knui TaxID=2025310 RepID=A0A3P1CZI5_9BACT|nr:hypothetical protein [Larkinella knui]RRB18304.1 hypothetical protein EHT87_08530 [Larkinella knui]
MWLYFSVYSLFGEILTHSLFANEIEIHMEILNQYTNTGHKVLSAHLIDQNARRTNLPLEAFDGEPIGDWMRQLQREYEQALRS